MKRNMIAGLCFIVLAEAIAIVWLITWRYRVEIVQAPQVVPSESAAHPEIKSPVPDKKTLFELPVRVAFFGADEYSPGYLDIENKFFYRWKDVVLTSEQLQNTPYFKPFAAISVLDPNGFTVTTVEAPVKYLEDNGALRLGYLDSMIGAFYAWKGVVLSKQDLLDKGEDGKTRVFQPGIPWVAGSPQVIEIEMPAYLKDQVAFFAGDEQAPGYVDIYSHSNIFYRWKGVVLTGEQMRHTPYKTIGILNAKRFIVATVEAPVKYLEVNGQFRPGFPDRTIGAFYACKGVVLSKEQLLDKDSRVFQFEGPKGAPPLLIEIEMPAYLKDHPELWKK